MKINVDLTEKGLFRGANNYTMLNSMLASIKTANKHPWEFCSFDIVKSDSDFNYKKPLIICGTHSDRQQAKERHKYESGECCDRCGASLVKKPWDRYYGLCSKCMDELELEVNKYWRYRFDPISESNNFVITMLNYRK